MGCESLRADKMSVKDAFNINDLILHVFDTYPVNRDGGIAYDTSNDIEVYVGYEYGKYVFKSSDKPWMDFRYDQCERVIDLEFMTLTLNFISKFDADEVKTSVKYPLVHADREGVRTWDVIK